MKIRLISTYLFLFSVLQAYPQQKNISVMYYDSEHFFDSLYVKKNDNSIPSHVRLVKNIIDSVSGNNQLPALVGLYEKEQQKVLEGLNASLTNFSLKYGIINARGKEAKLFDTGLLYDKQLFSVEQSEVLRTSVNWDENSSSILFTSLLFRKKEKIYVFVVHLNSEEEKENKHTAYLQLLRKIAEIKVGDPEPKIMILGADAGFMQETHAELAPEISSHVQSLKLQSPVNGDWRIINQIILSREMLSRQVAPLHLDAQTSGFGEEVIEVPLYENTVPVKNTHVKHYLSATLITLQYQAQL